MNLTTDKLYLLINSVDSSILELEDMERVIGLCEKGEARLLEFKELKEILISNIIT